MRAVFDTNVLVAARLSLLGKPSQCLMLAHGGFVQSVTCREILAEFEEKLIAKFNYSPPQAAEAAKSVRDCSALVELQHDLKCVPEDPDDDKVVECAVLGRAEFIVSGDRHLIALKQYQNIRIARPAEFLALVPMR